MKFNCYLAGPTVFRSNATEIYQYQREHLLQKGITPFTPVDSGFVLKEFNEEEACHIAMMNEGIIRLLGKSTLGSVNYHCPIILADISPFRGIYADAGTIYEIGIFSALYGPTGLIVAFSTDVRSYKQRTTEYYTEYTDDYSLIEDFGLRENLMIHNAVKLSGGKIFNSFEEAADNIIPLLEAKGIKPNNYNFT